MLPISKNLTKLKIQGQKSMDTGTSGDPTLNPSNDSCSS